MRGLLRLLSNIHDNNMAAWFERTFILVTAAVVLLLALQMLKGMLCCQSWIEEIHFPYDSDERSLRQFSNLALLSMIP